MGGGGGAEHEEKHTPLNMKPDVLGRFPTWYMHIHHTSHIEHDVKLEDDSDLTELERRHNLKKQKTKKKM